MKYLLKSICVCIEYNQLVIHEVGVSSYLDHFQFSIGKSEKRNRKNPEEKNKKGCNLLYMCIYVDVTSSQEQKKKGKGPLTDLEIENAIGDLLDYFEVTFATLKESLTPDGAPRFESDDRVEDVLLTDPPR